MYSPGLMARGMILFCNKMYQNVMKNVTKFLLFFTAIWNKMYSERKKIPSANHRKGEMNMKKVFALLLIVMLLMTACQPAGPAATVTEPTDPSTEATEPIVAYDPDTGYQTRYGIFPFNGEQSPDTADMHEGWLYSHDKKDDKIYAITDWVISEKYEANGNTFMSQDLYDITFGYIHVVSADRKSVIRCSYTGEDRTVVYETENEITHMSYGKGEMLCITEDAKRVILFEIPTGSKTVVTEQDVVLRAHYVTALVGSKGPYVMWYGAPGENGYSHIFQYYLETGELVDFFSEG